VIPCIIPCNTKITRRSKRQTATNIHYIRGLQESLRFKKLNKIKAFDSINREIMFKILRHYGIQTMIVNAIKAIYKNSRSAVIVEGNVSEEFDVTKGVLQGDTLAPFLFVITLDYARQKLTTQT